MKVLKLALCAAVASAAMSGAAAAQDAPEFSFNAGVTSDYIFRGVSQTMEDPAIFGGADVGSGMFYAGVWGSTVDFGDDTDAEIDVYAGITPTLGPVSADFGVIYYGYVNAPDGSNYDYWELKAAGSVPVGPATVGAGFFYSPEFFGETGEALYSELNASFSPTAKVSVGGAVGHQEIDLADDYTTWNLGLSYAFTDNITGDVRYHDTDLDACNICGERVVATVKASFP